MKWFLVLLIECCFLLSYGQYSVTGTCIDQHDEVLPMTSILIDGLTPTTAKSDGTFVINLSNGDHNLEFSFVGYETVRKEFTINNSDVDLGKVVLKDASIEIDEIVVTSNRFEQRIEELTTSIEVLQPEQLTKSGVVNLESAADQTPGVYIADGQANIRGGSGFSYGAGSRVLVLIDDLPIVSADAGDVKWDALPLENLEQIEVLKGASSALYGSSALNGVINIKTGFAGLEPKTEFRSYYGFYGSPKNINAVWWDKSPAFYGVNFSHSRKVKGHDVVIGMNYFDDQGYRLGETNTRYRANFKTKINTKVEGLYFGVNGNMMQTDGGQIFMWNDADSGMFVARNYEVNGFKNIRVNIDPYVTYYDDKGNTHKLRNRYYLTNNMNDNNQNSVGQVIYNEYLYQKRLGKHNVTGGLVSNYSVVESAIYGSHSLSNIAAYTQGDFSFDRLNISTGVRYEGYKSDDNKYEFKPNFRTGLNYKVFEPTFLRASFGQGFRAPTIAEKHINTSIPGLFFMPNEDLRSESGYSAEVGIKQLVKLGKWKGYVDVAGFISEYKDMIEFAFDSLKVNDLLSGDLELGFRGYNVERSRISGIDFSLMGMGSMGPINVTILSGYTYMNPINLDVDKTDSLYVEGDEILKYRFNHLMKSNLLLEYKGFSLGLNYRYSSQVRNIDEVFVLSIFNVEVIPGVVDFRERNNNGDSVLDVNLGYKYKVLEGSIIVKNILNEEYAPRPADPQPPRTFMFQLNMSI